jgi:pantothenate kinase type III
VDARSSPHRADVDEPLTVGADRIINTLAASQLFKKDTIVVTSGRRRRSIALPAMDASSAA